MNQEITAHSTHFGMGTVITHKIFGKNAKKALLSAKRATKRLEKLLSRFLPQSEISRLNRFAGVKRVPLSLETLTLLTKAQQISSQCHGAFDITIGPLVDLWQMAKKDHKLPPDDDIQRQKALVKNTDLELDLRKKTAYLARVGQSVDLGGIAKGYAADQILEAMKKHGISSAFTDFGGNVAVIGVKPDGTPWQVGIQQPRQENALIGVIALQNESLVTSGDYHQFFMSDDHKRFHHLIDPATGYPSESGWISVSILSQSSLEADALSTAVFLSGKEKSFQLLTEFPHVSAVLVDSNLKVFISNRLRDVFQPAAGVDIQVLD